MRSDAPLFERLFAPLRIGAKTLRNRIMMAPHGVTFLPGHGAAVDRIIDYHVERARGGAAMIVMSNFITPPSWLKLASWGGALDLSPLGGLDMASDPALRPAYQRLAQGVHDEGAIFVAQLNATGRQYYQPGMLAYGLPLVAPSPLACPRTRHVPREMTIADIEELVATFAGASVNLCEAGADGVELFAAQGYLLSEFLSPHTNWRDDQYGGSLENRMRIVTDALTAIRKAAGDGFIIGIRMNGDDYAPGGVTSAMARDIAAALTAQRLVDYIHVSAMTYLHYPAWIAEMNAPDATFAHLAEGIRAAAGKVPVAVTTRIGSPVVAEHILAREQADFVGMARALISDPELPNKARAGDVSDIRVCTYSNQSCSMGQTLGRGVACMQNIAVGKEAKLGVGRMTPAARAKRVLVIGGGPAGMAAARIAGERGHQVTLVEKETRLGGQNRMTAMMQARRGFAEVTRWQEHRLRRMNVDLRLEMIATPDWILAEDADAVVIATGSRPRRDGYSGARPDVRRLPGVDQGNVLTAWDVFSTPERIGRSVLVIDDDPHLAGAYVAEHLASSGRAVTLVTPHLHPARELHINFAPELYRRLRGGGVTIVTDALITAIGGESVRILDRHGEEERMLTGIDTVILSIGNEVDNALALALEGRVGELHVVGDCVAPRKIDEAILDGERAGWML